MLVRLVVQLLVAACLLLLRSSRCRIPYMARLLSLSFSAHILWHDGCARAPTLAEAWSGRATVTAPEQFLAGGAKRCQIEPDLARMLLECSTLLHSRTKRAGYLTLAGPYTHQGSKRPLSRNLVSLQAPVHCTDTRFTQTVKDSEGHSAPASLFLHCCQLS